MSEWIDWQGGECPVAGDARVDVRMRRGALYANERADFWDWARWGHDYDIVSYRVVAMVVPAADLAAKDAEIARLTARCIAAETSFLCADDERITLRAELAVAREALTVLARVAEEANDYTNVPTFSPSMHRDLRDALEAARAAIKGES